MIQYSTQGHNGRVSDGKGENGRKGEGGLRRVRWRLCSVFFWTATETIHVSFFSKDQ